MKILMKKQLEDLIDDYPDGGIVFAEYTPDIYKSELMVTDGDFGATRVLPSPVNGKVFDFDWYIKEYRDDDQFAIFDNNDVLQMIQTLTKGLKINLEAWFEEDEQTNS